MLTLLPEVPVAVNSTKHLLDEHIRAEIAGKRKCSKKTLASEYGVCEKTIKNICKEFENEPKVVKAITAAEQYYSLRRNLRLQPSVAQAVLQYQWKT